MTGQEKRFMLGKQFYAHFKFIMFYKCVTTRKVLFSGREPKIKTDNFFILIKIWNRSKREIFWGLHGCVQFRLRIKWKLMFEKVAKTCMELYHIKRKATQLSQYFLKSLLRFFFLFDLRPIIPLFLTFGKGNNFFVLQKRVKQIKGCQVKQRETKKNSYKRV